MAAGIWRRDGKQNNLGHVLSPANFDGHIPSSCNYNRLESLRLSAGIDSISLLAFKNNQVHGSLVEALRVAKNSIHVGLHGVAKTIPFEASKYAHFPVFDLSLVRTRRSSSADGLHVVAVELLDVVKAERVHYEGSYALLYPMLSYPNTTHLCLDRVTAPDFGLRLGVFPNLQHLELSNAQISYKCKAQGVVAHPEQYWGV